MNFLFELKMDDNLSNYSIKVTRSNIWQGEKSDNTPLQNSY